MLKDFHVFLRVFHAEISESPLAAHSGRIQQWFNNPRQNYITKQGYGGVYFLFSGK